MPVRHLREGKSPESYSVTKATIDEGARFPDVPEGAVVITEAEYTELLGGIKASVAEKRAAVEADELAEAKAAYTALAALPGITEATARRLSGYTGP